MALISIIIPSFNAEAHIRNALNSILNQTNKDFEIVVIDGRSSDGTCRIVQSFQACDSCITLLSEPDKGIYDAMNKGIDMAKGEWLYFLGSDDRLKDSTVLEKINEVLEKSKPDILYGNVMFQPQKIVYDGEFDFSKLLQRNICHQGIFYRKSVFAKIGGYTIAFKLHADWDLNLRVFKQNNLIIRYINMIVADFTTGSSSSRHDALFLRTVLLPSWINNLGHSGLTPGSLTNFDNWWRLVRNSEIPWIGDPLTATEKIPDFLKTMIDQQRRYSYNKLKNGYFSKLVMFWNYVKFRMG